MSQKLRKTIILNLRWHRRIGLSVVIMVIFLAITGLLLNHSPSLSLSKQTLQYQWLMDWYGFESDNAQPVEHHGFNMNEKWLSHSGHNELFLNGEPVANCRPPLLGAAQFQSLLLALCQDALVIITPEGELVEKLDQLSGLPNGSTALQVVNQKILINADNQTVSFDIDTLEIKSAPPLQKGWSTSSPLPTQLAEQLDNSADRPGISLETLILDLHSGRFFGNAGVLFVDLVGLLICLLALTGLWAWYSHNKLRKSGG
ncbi:MAG: PepSY-associated TM helix domain-containing protein [Porticoccus sp.]